jgi:hypothetical protein
LRIQTNAFLNLSCAAQFLNVFGTVEVEEGGRLRVDDCNQKTLSLLEGSATSGTGTIQLDSAILSFNNTTLSGGVWRLTGNSGLAGNTLLRVAAGAILSIENSLSYGGSIEVAGALNVPVVSATLTIASNLNLLATGSLTNSGTIRTAAFNNQGTVVGNEPIVTGGGSGFSRIETFTVRSVSGIGPATKAQLTSSANTQVVLEWRIWPGTICTIESSTDLVTWRRIRAEIIELSPGNYRAILNLPPAAPRFFRISWPAH